MRLDPMTEVPIVSPHHLAIQRQGAEVIVTHRIVAGAIRGIHRVALPQAGQEFR
mgnify:CR=1 FL=1